MNDTRSQQIIDAILTTIKGITDVQGVTDDVPWDYDNPPKPAINFGDPRLPFAWVYDLGEDDAAGNYNSGNDVELFRDLRVQIEIAFRFQRYGESTLSKLGRSLLGDIQLAMAADRTFGGVSWDVKEGRSTREEAPVENVGVVVSEWIVTYHRAFSDPTQA
jgi:hypothetical protein